MGEYLAEIKRLIKHVEETREERLKKPYRRLSLEEREKLPKE